MILTLDNLAERYKMLPSEALDRATTFDLYVLDVSSRWVKYQHELADNKSKGLGPPAPRLSQEQLRAMMQRAQETK